MLCPVWCLLFCSFCQQRNPFAQSGSPIAVNYQIAVRRRARPSNTALAGHLEPNLIITSVRGPSPVLASCILMTRTVPSNLIASSVSRYQGTAPGRHLAFSPSPSAPRVTWSVLVLRPADVSLCPLLPSFLLSRYSAEPGLCNKNPAEEFAESVCGVARTLSVSSEERRGENRSPLFLGGCYIDWGRRYCAARGMNLPAMFAVRGDLVVVEVAASFIIQSVKLRERVAFIFIYIPKLIIMFVFAPTKKMYVLRSYNYNINAHKIK